MRELKTFFVRTYGCQMNELDSELMIGALEQRGLRRVESEEDGDLLVFNTCSIRDLAERKVMGKIGILGRRRKNRPMIGVTGCMANAKKDQIFRKLPHVDFVLGTNNIADLNAVLDEVIETGQPSLKVDTTFEENLNYFDAVRDDKVKAFVSIIRGCDKYCTYCVVPYTRGKEVSRPPEDVEAECRALAAKGYKEITLLGQNVNSYGLDQPGWNETFPELLYRLDKIEGIERIRFMTSHPCDITVSLMEAIRDLPSLCEFVHFPIQAGSSRILRKMNRRYTLESYLETVAKFREIVPNVSLGTDIIVGFPTETEEEFQMTYNILEKLRYSVAFIFSYSARKGTPAFRWKDDVPEEVKKDRLHRLLALQEQIANEQLAGFIGTDEEILIEKQTKTPGQLVGRTRCWKKAIVSGGPELIGTLQNVKINGYNNSTLIGELLAPSSLALAK